MRPYTSFQFVSGKEINMILCSSSASGEKRISITAYKNLNLNLTIYLSSVTAVDLEPVPGTLDVRQKYSLDGMPVLSSQQILHTAII